LAANDETKNIPVIFMTALAQERELDALMSLGARGVIHKPFDAGSLPQRVRQILAGTKFEGLKERLYACSERFRRRLASDKRVFASARLAFQGEVVEANELDGLHRCSHQLAGAAGVFAIQDVSTLASNLEASVVEFRTGTADRQVVTERLDLLIACIDRYRPCEAQAMPHVRWAEPKAGGAIA
jgi:response regulator RpfG family c-di-GMP phosphodiesterase